MAEVQNLPVKGTVWRHVRRTNYDGTPMELTVTSITNGLVYSRDKYRGRVKTPVAIFEAMCKEIVSVPGVTEQDRGPKLMPGQCQDLFRAAHAAGMKAGEECRPTPMVVEQHLNPLDDNSPVTRRYGPIADGVCGYATVLVRPGNSSFATWLKKYKGASKGYYGGVSYYVGEFGQSYERKTAYARAFAQVLEEAGIKAYGQSRLD
jgi:hypothetical protein